MPLELPPPLPGEIIYSALARACHRMGWATTRFTHRLFAGRTIIVRPHLCGQIDLVAHVTAMVADWPFSAEHLRDHHTLYPLVAPLLAEGPHHKCLVALHGDRTGRHHVGIARQLLGITPFTELLSCPRCRREDRSKYGEAYFHRIHQVPGTTLCALHCCALQACAVTAEPDFYTALDEITEFRTLRVPARNRALQTNVATDLCGLLESPAAPGSLAASLPHLLDLASRLSTVGRSPLMQLVILAANCGAPLSVVPPAPVATTRTRLRSGSASKSDGRWLSLARRFLPDHVAALKDRYRRRIAFLTLKRALETHAQSRLPARAYIPRTAAFIDTFVEHRAAAADRLLNCSSKTTHDERTAA